MLLICYPKCTTCQRARKWLDQRGASYTPRDIKEDRPTREELNAWWKASGAAAEKVFQYLRAVVQSPGPQGPPEGHDGGGTADPAGHRWDAGQAADPGGRGACAGGLPSGGVGEAIKKLPGSRTRKLDNVNKTGAVPAKAGPRPLGFVREKMFSGPQNGGSGLRAVRFGGVGPAAVRRRAGPGGGPRTEGGGSLRAAEHKNE